MNIILTGLSATIILDGNPYTIAKDHARFPALLEAYRSEDEDKVRKIINVLTNVREWSNKNAEGDVKVVDGAVYYKEFPMENAITARIIEWVDLDLDPQPMINFLESIMSNPSYQSREELLLFLETNNLPIQKDGSFLAYKVVTSEFKDKHTRKFDNSIGATVQMDRGCVDDKRSNTCSAGLHFCSKDYVGSFMRYDDKLVLVAVKPADVVSIPHDYNNAKGRCCKYKVVEEVDLNQKFNSPLFTAKADKQYIVTVTDGDEVYSYVKCESEKFQLESEGYIFDNLAEAQKVFYETAMTMLIADVSCSWSDYIVELKEVGTNTVVSTKSIN